MPFAGDAVGGIGSAQRHALIDRHVIADDRGFADDDKAVINEEIAEILRRRESPPDIMEMRMRMARIPKGGGLIRNPLGPHGFYIENVYVMAGIPQVMQAMVGSLEGQLRRGVTIQSLSVTAYLPESHVARRLGEIQDKYPHIDLGSYPFHRNDQYGTTLVMRGSDEAALEAMRQDVRQMIIALGGTPEEAK